MIKNLNKLTLSNFSRRRDHQV